MQTRQVVALVAIITIIALALGTTIGYSISAGRTTTSMSTQTQTITSYGFPRGLSTVTELIIISYVAQVTAYVCGSSSFVAGIVNGYTTNTTEYIFPSIINVTSEQRFLNVTIMTVTSTETDVTSSVTATTVTLTATSQGNTTECPTIV
jgi:uncharacterized membrane protein YqgA involved in biofilm formation